jgi:hypothetical protein
VLLLCHCRKGQLEDLAHNFTGHNDDSIHWRCWISGSRRLVGIWGLVAQVVITGGAGLRFGLAEIRGIAFYP